MIGSVREAGASICMYGTGRIKEAGERGFWMFYFDVHMVDLLLWMADIWTHVDETSGVAPMYTRLDPPNSDPARLVRAVTATSEQRDNTNIEIHQYSLPLRTVMVTHVFHEHDTEPRVLRSLSSSLTCFSSLLLDVSPFFFIGFVTLISSRLRLYGMGLGGFVVERSRSAIARAPWSPHVHIPYWFLFYESTLLYWTYPLC
ncbi:hypothetical protein FRC14_000924 [Serendipita sp. 396]|nr:hypothetical protein FRC14_000924 [Serendipita sp. 396]KAG8774799.1 hypothetical protein FRC15_001039 [Serendipita sp. 397]KAG8790325.1 hypothetical protein FRC16_000907 [Serendipita sp. 398]KAG8834285.1 hypothetical protein FRC18_002263 [Serendipita sp. 400]KAG8854419.1 hypothetical protein FRC20_000990 [Serendipita sp. 405]